MFDVFKFFVKLLWATYSAVKAYYKACFDFVVVVGVEMHVVVCWFVVDFKS